MKNLVFILFTALGINALCQAPQNISYQAILRDNVNVLIQNAPNVAVRVSIIQGALIDNNTIYVENHSTSTNANGLFTIEIGGGTVVSGNYPTIQWGAGPFFLKTEIDPLGGTNYLITAITELLSVPFANFANQAARHPGTAGLLEGRWSPVVDGIGTGEIFMQYVSPTSISLSYVSTDMNGETGWYTDIVLIAGEQLFSPLDGTYLDFSVTDSGLTISVSLDGEVFSSTYVRL